MTVSSTLEARLRGRAPSSAPGARDRQGARHLASSTPTSPRRASTTSRTGATAPAGASLRGLLGATGLSPRRATLAHGAAIYGAAQVTLPALEIAPPSIYWGAEEVAIDAFHHAVYAAATGLAYAAITR